MLPNLLRALSLFLGNLEELELFFPRNSPIDHGLLDILVDGLRNFLSLRHDAFLLLGARGRGSSWL